VLKILYTKVAVRHTIDVQDICGSEEVGRVIFPNGARHGTENLAPRTPMRYKTVRTYSTIFKNIFGPVIWILAQFLPAFNDHYTYLLRMS